MGSYGGRELTPEAKRSHASGRGTGVPSGVAPCHHPIYFTANSVRAMLLSGCFLPFSCGTAISMTVSVR